MVSNLIQMMQWRYDMGTMVPNFHKIFIQWEDKYVANG